LIDLEKMEEKMEEKKAYVRNRLSSNLSMPGFVEIGAEKNQVKLN